MNAPLSAVEIDLELAELRSPTIPCPPPDVEYVAIDLDSDEYDDED